jgi:hypothetical protein
MMIMKNPLSNEFSAGRFRLGLILLVLLFAGIARSQVAAHVPSKERVDPSLRRRTEIDGNNVRTSVFNFAFSGRTGVGQGVPYEWPKNTGRDYIALIALYIGGEVKDDTGATIHVVDLPAFRQKPGGADWNINPVPGYFNLATGKIAKSDDPTTWPPFWPDKLTDPGDPGWKGEWNGYFGKNLFNADQEMYYRAGDDNYDRYNYHPDTTDLTRHGLGAIVDVRVLQWSQVSVADAVFFIQEVKNDGTKDIPKAAVTLWLADFVGGEGDSQDDAPDFDLILDIAYSLDHDGISSNPAFLGVCVGAAATLYLETPGNAEDRIDNDGDSPENPQTGGGPPVTADMLQGEIPGDGIDNNHNGLIDEDSTYIAFGTQNPVTFADGIDNNNNGEDGSPVVTQAMIDEAALDSWTDPSSGTTYHWHRWPPNPETDPMQQGLDGKPIIHLIEVTSPDLGKKFKDNIDNNGNSYGNLPTVTQGMIDSAASDGYHRYRVPGTNVILYNLTQADSGKKYLNKDGLRDAGVDEGIDEMVDESRNDGIDNDGDWNPLTDDVGLDGVPNTHDFGEGDGRPTSGAGTPFPGEPHIDKTDVKEADQVGLTNVQYLPAGAINFSTTPDIYFWATFMIPGSFVNPALIGVGDFDLFVSSGVFPLRAGNIERISYAVVFGNASRCPGNAVYTGAKDDATRKRKYAQLAYNENYQFAQAPIEPTLTAVPGDRRVTLYWDDKSEKSVDRFLAGIPGAKSHDFEGYRIYRATDPAFQDAAVITDAFGNPAPWLKPIAQFDLKDSISGFSAVAYNGVHFYLGDETGIVHSWIDTNVTNGIKYYYAVRGYDQGYTPLEIAPTESNLKISIDNVTGKVTEIGTSVAIVIPEASAAGYIPPKVSQIKLVQGSTTGFVGYTVVDPTHIKDDHNYRITFEDTVLIGQNHAPDTFKTKSYTLADITNNPTVDTLIGRRRELADTVEQPLTDGFRLYFHNEKFFGLNEQKSFWNNTGVWPFVFQQYTEDDFVVGQQKPSDYRVEFGPPGYDTSKYFKIEDDNAGTQYYAPSVPVNFRVFNTSENRKIAIAFYELDLKGGPGIFSAHQDPTAAYGTASDIIIFLEPDAHDSLVVTYEFKVRIDTTLHRAPTNGDIATLTLSKLFRSGDVFEFSTKAQTVVAGPSNADSLLARIKVVPNPYVAAVVWEPQNPYTTGRGPRSIHFNHLPKQCTIRIYTVSGELVTTIHHDAPILDGSEEWNLLTRDNLSVAYGVYIWHVDAPGIGEKVGKLALIK